MPGIRSWLSPQSSSVLPAKGSAEGPITRALLSPQSRPMASVVRRADKLAGGRKKPPGCGPQTIADQPYLQKGRLKRPRSPSDLGVEPEEAKSHKNAYSLAESCAPPAPNLLGIAVDRPQSNFRCLEAGMGAGG